jgi:amidohydrolase/hippurate hydrolase
LNNYLSGIIDKVYPEAVAVRRAIHTHPELSGEEFKTAQLVYDCLESLNLKPRFYINKTGVAARIVNGKGKTVVLRADMDALPIEEKTGAPFASGQKGVMHACGHDMHTACLLAAVKVLLLEKNRWKGTIVALFQPSEEEAPGGALRMIHEKAFPASADAVIGLHVSVDHATGTIGLKPGRDYSGVLDFDVKIIGKGGHGATPHKTVDPIVCSCAIIMELQTLVSRESPAYEPSVLTIGSLHAGTKHNIIPDEVCFCGTIRTFSGEHQKLLMRRASELISMTAKSFCAKADVSFTQSYPPGFNDMPLTERAKNVMAAYLGKNKVVIRPNPSMYSEDFAYFQQKAPGLFVHLGVASPSDRNPAGIHTGRFLPEEHALKTGIAVHAAMALDILKA